MPNPLRFEEVTADTYAQAFVDTCTVTETRRGVLLTGTCPRCADAMDYPVKTKVYMNSTAASPSSTPRPVMCTCQGAHPGRPDDDEGCGAYWNVTLPEPPP